MAERPDRAVLPVAESGDGFSDAQYASEERRPERQFCIFRAGRERFCLSVLEIEEVVDWPIVTRIPLAPACIDASIELEYRPTVTVRPGRTGPSTPRSGVA